MSRIRFGIVGSGWRTDFYLRIAKALPERFEVSGVVVRNEEKARKLAEDWQVPVYRSIASLVEDGKPAFVVTSVPWDANPGVIEELARIGMPVLSETPPAPDLNALSQLNEKLGHARIQVAEQYAFQPIHAARIAIARSGKLGTVTQAQVSAAHGYHGISLLRKLLGVTSENARIQAYRFAAPLVNGPGRDGAPNQEVLKESEQMIVSLDFEGKLAVYDFTGDQYFSWIRSPRVLVRGERGEINNREVRYLKDYSTPVELELRRLNAGEDGNLEGFYHKGIIAGEEWVYRNPFVPGRLSDDEIAIATCLAKMAEYAAGGPDFYSLAEASQDHYISLMMNESLRTGEPVQTETQVWWK
ncbi:Gfo/Idh/MocA family protein [Paenibacillus sp. OV219]|uniref:Gfo/Idh/MocA family protein n=1 Tax=Paenibacillus sp. OV219 TaxID=1884377 RepID=UPI0008AAB25D|nr:Gfo/Idh/MocA family oxidoreductase [Paenibacillus sp. OV219]SEO13045.1 Oxidoreductase family, NAD-binding Rossmann fold [Paenibacillus sp. OV219]